MKQKCLLFYLVALLFFFSACKKESIEQRTNSETYAVYSSHLKKEYTLYVKRPKDYDSNKSYRTIILLDANDYFVEMADEIGDDFILVGVAYNDFNEREKDFTYPAMSEVSGSGNAREYVRFLSEELLPYLQDSLGIHSVDKTLMGHSLSGYLAVYLFFQQEITNPFENVIAASPSLWWADAYVFGLEERYNQNHSQLTANLFLTMGDLEGVMMNTHFNAFVKRIEQQNYSSEKFDYRVYENISHRNSPIISFKDGLNFIQ